MAVHDDDESDLYTMENAWLVLSAVMTVHDDDDESNFYTPWSAWLALNVVHPYYMKLLVLARVSSEPPNQTVNHQTEPPWTTVWVQFLVHHLKVFTEPVWTTEPYYWIEIPTTSWKYLYPFATLKLNW